MEQSTKHILKKLLGIPQNEGLSIDSFLKNWRLRIGPYIYKKSILQVMWLELWRMLE